MAKDRSPGTRSSRRMTDEAKKLQERLRKYIVSQYAFSAKMEAKKLSDFARRARRVDAYQQRITEAGLRALGVDPLEIRERHIRDFALARRAAQIRKKELLAHANAIAREQSLRTKRWQALRDRYERELGNPFLRLFLCERATRHHWISSFGSANAFRFSNIGYFDAKGSNVTHWGMKGRVGGGDTASFTAILSDEFVWESDRDGVLNVQALFELNALYDLHVEPKCIGQSVAGLRMGPRIYVAQNASGSTDAVLDNGADDAFLNVDLRTGCQGFIDNGMALPIDTGIVTLEQSNFPVVASKPVLVTVALVVEGLVYNDGGIELDFMNAPGLEMNTLFVALTVNS